MGGSGDPMDGGESGDCGSATMREESVCGKRSAGKEPQLPIDEVDLFFFFSFFSGLQEPERGRGTSCFPIFIGAMRREKANELWDGYNR